ncbi:CobW/HypB/UreG, nucleotide-binding domain-containing protein [Powellomyces hirtus]|nr:CobW/HypB/UreG, nucleotide-binding domain-containing protein [Powellomyces hirtus]
MDPIPITVFTGFLGAGKTTIILSLIQRLPPGYNVVLLKNEFGDVKVDSELARESNVQVTEMLNGCMCCVLVGQMKNALEEIRDTQKPSRIIIETSGSAFPAPIAWQIRQLSSSFSLDAIITVIDCVNFEGYEDTSYTARLQAQYTDVILLNKHSLVTERQLDDVIDRVNDLNTDTVKIKVDEDKGVAPDLVFGLDSKLFELNEKEADENKWAAMIDPKHMQNEVQVVTIEAGVAGKQKTTSCEKSDCHHDHEDDCSEAHSHSDSSVDTSHHVVKSVTKEDLTALFGPIPADTVYRIKGFLYIVNWAFGRMELTPVRRTDGGHRDVGVRLTVMGQFGMKVYVEKIKKALLG